MVWCGRWLWAEAASTSVSKDDSRADMIGDCAARRARNRQNSHRLWCRLLKLEWHGWALDVKTYRCSPAPPKSFLDSRQILFRLSITAPRSLTMQG